MLANAEFGRTPRVNRGAGRDHWPWVYSLALAGGGDGGGVGLGASDAIAAYPTAHPHDPADLAATVYHLLGVPPDTVRPRPDRPAARAGRRAEDRRAAGLRERPDSSHLVDADQFCTPQAMPFRLAAENC